MVTASIVLFHNNIDLLTQAVDSFLATPIEKKLYLIDNSQTDALGSTFRSEEIQYIHTGQNLGFGKAHNLILRELEAISEFHLVLNPDVYFDSDVIPLLINDLKSDAALGLIAPKILYPDGSFQNSIRRFPKFRDLLIRRIPFFKRIFKKAFRRGNYLDHPLNKPMYVDAVSGCFQLFKTQIFLDIDGFDSRYFMYMEDIDICKKVHVLGNKVLYNPNAIVYHHSEYGSKRSLKLFLIHMKSIFRYFNKWN